MIILGTIPVGLAGVLLDHPVRTVLAKPIPTAIFLTLNGFLLFGGEMLRRRRAGVDASQVAVAADQGGYRDGAYQDSRGRRDIGSHRAKGRDDRGAYPGLGHGTDRGYRDDPRSGGDRGGQGRRYSEQGNWQQGYGQQGYGDRGYRDDQRGGQSGYADQRGGGQWGGDQRGGGQHRNDRWGDDQFGYDRRGDHGGFGPHGQGDAGGIGGGPYGDDPWGGDSRRDDPWGGSQQGGYQQGGYDQRGGRGYQQGGNDQRGGYQQGGYEGQAQGHGGRHSGRHSPGRPSQSQGDYRQQAYGQRGGYDQQAPQHATAGRRSARQPSAKEQEADRAIQADQRLVKMSFVTAIALGASQILALFPGFSRDGSVMVAGLGRGLSRQDAVRFSFLLSAPVILAAGIFKAKELMGPETTGIHGPIIAGSLVAGVAAYFALMFLDRFLSNPKRTLTPFAIYCVIMGLFCLVFI
jgi:undecaprenyl pyrophosphate phosphatase UppP